jgi:hypothetical protein
MEGSGLSRPETLQILRETYNDLAPKEEQWGTNPRGAPPPQLLPGQDAPGTVDQKEVDRAVAKALEKAGFKASAAAASPPSQPPAPQEHKPGMPPPGKPPGYPDPDMPSLDELRRMVAEREKQQQQ